MGLFFANSRAKHEKKARKRASGFVFRLLYTLVQLLNAQFYSAVLSPSVSRCVGGNRI